MLKGLTSTFKEHCNNIELTYNEYIVIDGVQVPVRAKLTDDCYENGNFIGSFILKTIQFETSNDRTYRNKEFEYYKVVDGESIKIGTFITTEIQDNDTKELVKVTGMDYGLKTQVEYTSTLNYESGTITLLDVWNECCQLSGLESGVSSFENSDFIVDSDQFTGTGATIRDVFKGIALSSGSFIKVMNDDKIYPIFKTHTETLMTSNINTQATLENVQEIDKINELKGNSYQTTTRGLQLIKKQAFSTPKSDTTFWENATYTTPLKDGWCKIERNNSSGTSNVYTNNYLNTGAIDYEPNTQYTIIYEWRNAVNVAGCNLSQATQARNPFNADWWAPVQETASGTRIILATTKSTLESNYWGLRNFFTTQAGKKMSVEVRCMIIKGNYTSQDVDFEYYSGGTPGPNPDYPQEIESVTGRQIINVCKKNLFSSEMELGSLSNTTGQPNATNNAIRTKYFIPIKPNTTYTISNDKDYYCYSYEYDKDYNFIARHGAQTEDYKGKSTITTSSNAKYLKVRTVEGFIENDLSSKWQLEKGNQATSYEEYDGNNYEINLGKNLFDVSSVNGIGGIVVEDNKIIMPIITSGNGQVNTNKKLKELCPDMKAGEYYFLSFTRTPAGYNNFIYLVSGGDVGWNNNTSKLITDELLEKTVVLYANRYNQGETDQVTLSNFQIERGQEATIYAPYFTPIKLNKVGNYKDIIKKSSGKNLFNKDNANKLDGYINSAGTITSEATNKTIYIPCKSSTTYTVSKIASTRFGIASYSTTPQIGSTTSNFTRDNSATHLTLTTRSSDTYLAVWYYNSNTDTLTEQQILDSIQIEVGETATSYEPYGKIWYIERNTRKLELATADMDNGENYPGWTNQEQLKSDVFDGTVVGSLTYYTDFYTNIDNFDFEDIRVNFNNLATLFIRKNKYDYSQTYWKTTYPNLVFTLTYGLRKPTIEKITNQALINQLESIRLLKGTNNISITSEDLSGEINLSYWKDDTELIEDYTELEDKRDTHPITCVRLGMSQVDGENVDMIDPDLVEEYGENWLILNDNPFAYNQSKREQLITAIFNKVKGFGYSAFVSKTSFKPYLVCGDKVRFKNRNGNLIDSILLRYSHEYKENDMQIQLEAPSETSATVNYVYPLTAIDISKRTQVEVDKDNVRITDLTQRTTEVETDLRNNRYTKEETNILIQTAETGLTNTFSKAGGNNIFRNTGLFFVNHGSDSSINPYEFWNGKVARGSEDKASNQNCLILQNDTVSQEQTVPNGMHTVSFKYKKLIAVSNAKVIINENEYELTGTTDTDFLQVVEVNSKYIRVQFVCDVDNGCEIYDLMVNAGEVALAYSQNQNETTTNTVNISKGIEITSSEKNTKFRADSDGIRVYNKDSNEVKTEFTDRGMETDQALIETKAEIVKTLWQNVNNHTWITRL